MPRVLTGLFGVLIVGFLSIESVFASESHHVSTALNLTTHWVGYAALAIFAAAYLLVILEEHIHLRKSKPVILAAGLIWILVALIYQSHSDSELIESSIRHNFLEYAELFFFLLVAMTYINAMLERGVFEQLRHWLIAQKLSYRILFWLTGLLAFLISPVADNLTTSLIMCAVVMAVANGLKRFICVSCINIVIAANAGGAFSPFGDITTLMVWQKGVIEFKEFFNLFLPALINWVIPAFIMSFAIPAGRPESTQNGGQHIKAGGFTIVFLFLATIITAVCFHNFLNIPPVFGMMTGLGYLKLFSYSLKRRSQAWRSRNDNPPSSQNDPYSFDVFANIAQAEWDTLFFFYGVILAVGGLGFIGYLELTSAALYGSLGATNANVLIGIMSSIVDNIPVMFAVLTMHPDMSHSQWLLVTLTAGVGGSLLSIGSAAGVALMGQARGYYTFFGHLKWTPAIALGYAASIAAHAILNGPL
ncbi:MAG: sodium:proton antiporter NhaD [Gammaproteobacteria bacterium]